jgi:hypothetical protein
MLPGEHVHFARVFLQISPAKGFIGLASTLLSVCGGKFVVYISLSRKN